MASVLASGSTASIAPSLISTSTSSQLSEGEVAAPVTPDNPTGAFPSSSSRDSGLDADRVSDLGRSTSNNSQRSQDGTPRHIQRVGMHSSPRIGTLQANSTPRQAGVSSPARHGSPGGGDAQPWEKVGLLRSCGGDMEKALDAALAERNNLATQNAQLWKLMERQRAQASALGKDVDRLRSERDRANQKLAQLGLFKSNGSISSPALDRSQPSNAEAGPSHTRGMTGSSSASAIGLGMQESVSASTQRLASDPVASDRPGDVSPTSPQEPTSTTTIRPPVLFRHQSDSGTEELERKAAEDYRKAQIEARAAPAPGPLAAPNPSGTESPARPPRSGSRDAAQTGRMPQPTLPPPALALPAVPEQQPANPAAAAAPSAESSKSSLLPSPTIEDASTLASLPQPAGSSISFEPEVKHFLAAMATPMQDGFGSIPPPGTAVDPQRSDRSASPSPDRSPDAQPLAQTGSDTAPSNGLADTCPSPKPQSATPEPTPSPGPLSDLLAKSPPGRAMEPGDLATRATDRGQASAERDDSPAHKSGPAGNLLATPSPAREAVQARPAPSSESSPKRSPQLPSQASHIRQPARPEQPQRTTTPPLMRPRLDLPPNGFSPQYLPYTRVTVAASRIAPNTLGRDVLFFISQVQCKAPRSNEIYTWQISKLFSAFLELDNEVRAVVGGRKEAKAIGLVQLPDGKAWKDFAPSKIDQRKAALEAYLQSLLSAPIADKNSIARFLCTNIVDQQVAPIVPAAQDGVKSGYLTKRGKAFGGWKTRYFVLDGPSLNYYDNRGGALLGTIPIAGAQIGRQHREQSDSSDDKAYRHAFLIIEPRKAGSTAAPTRHVLCAESDAERDAWVEALVRFIFGGERASRTSRGGEDGAESQRSARPPMLSRAGTSETFPAAAVQDERAVDGQQHRMPAQKPPQLATSQPEVPSSRESSPTRRTVSPPQASDIRDGHRSHHAPAAATQTGSRELDIRHTERADASWPSQTSSNSPAARQDVTPLRIKRQSMMPPPRHPAAASAATQNADRLHEERRLEAAPVVAQPTREREPPKKLHREKNQNQSSVSSLPSTTPAVIRQGLLAVDPRSDRERKAKSGRFWGFGKGSSAPQPAAATGRPVFGVPLEQALEVASIANLPAIVFRCIKYLEAQGAAQEEGIFRLSGSSAVIKALRERFNEEGDIDLLAVDERWDLHAISGLLKLFLRELPSNLLTRDLQIKFLAVIDLVSTEERVAELTKLVSELPLPNYSLLRALTSHLILIVAHSEQNKMSLRNIGIVFSPTLGIPAGIFSELVTNFHQIFDVSAGDVPLAGIPEADDKSEAETIASTTDLSDAADDQTARQPHLRVEAGNAESRKARHRNSQVYTASGVEALLGTGGRVLASQPEESDQADSIMDSEHGSSMTGRASEDRTARMGDLSVTRME